MLPDSDASGFRFGYPLMHLRDFPSLYIVYFPTNGFLTSQNKEVVLHKDALNFARRIFGFRYHGCEATGDPLLLPDKMRWPRSWLLFSLALALSAVCSSTSVDDYRAIVFVKQLKVGGSTVGGIIRQIMKQRSVSHKRNQLQHHLTALVGLLDRYGVDCTPPVTSPFTLVPEDGSLLVEKLDEWATSADPDAADHKACYANHGARRHIYPVDITGTQHIWGKARSGVIELEFIPKAEHKVFLMTTVRNPVERLFSFLHFRASKLFNKQRAEESGLDGEKANSIVRCKSVFAVVI